jgi:hypothetical protein
MLQLSPNDQIFEKGKYLLCLKWGKECKVKEQLDEFFQEWSTGWHKGYSIGDPSQNNGLESNNRYLKEDELDNNRLGIVQYLNKVKNDVVKK